MIYLKDTCVFINYFDAFKLLQLLQSYKNSSDTFGITDVVIGELNPGKSVVAEDAEKSKSMLGLIDLLGKSKDVLKYNVEQEEKYKINFNNIRRRFYGHLDDVQAVKKAVKKGEISQESFKNKTYRRKDVGECSCIAVAMLDPDNINIVSDDKGRVFLKPEINLFDKFVQSNGIRVLEFNEWLDEFGDYEYSKSG